MTINIPDPVNIFAYRDEDDVKYLLPVFFSSFNSCHPGMSGKNSNCFRI